MWLVTRVWEWKSFLSLDFSRLIFYRTSSDTGRRGLGRIRICTRYFIRRLLLKMKFGQFSTIIQRERGRVIRTELITKWREYIVSRGKIFCADPPPISLRARRPANSTGYNPFARPAYCMPYRLARCKFRNTWRRRV